MQKGGKSVEAGKKPVLALLLRSSAALDDGAAFLRGLRLGGRLACKPIARATCVLGADTANVR